VPLAVERRQDGFITTSLPPHSMATIEFSSPGAERH